MTDSRAIAHRIKEAVAATKAVVPGYFEKTCEGRISKSGCGSVFAELDSVEKIEEALYESSWSEYSHPDLQDGTTAFATHDLHGFMGVVKLSELPSDALVALDDRKGTGKVSAVVKGVRGQETTLTVVILGDEQGKEVVFTFHPGEPVRASQVSMEPGMHGREVTVDEALKMGLVTAKITD